MNDLAAFCRHLKEGVTTRGSPRMPVSSWSEPDTLYGKRCDAFVLILRTRGCSWIFKSGCTMCGYFNDSVLKAVSDEDLRTQIDIAFEKYAAQPLVKVFTSGSFLDSHEVPTSVQDYLLERFYEGSAKRISVESRPEYVTEERVEDIRTRWPDKEFEVGIGLESASDLVREQTLNKGFSFDEYRTAAGVLHDHDCFVKTYVLHKPPFMTEAESIEDAVATIEAVKDMTDIVSLNPVNVQRNTLVAYLWKRGEYRPPWLWSVAEVLRRGKNAAPDVAVKCDPVGGGGIRGAHDCRTCDKAILKAIKEFSLSQDVAVLDTLPDCDCKAIWRFQLEKEADTFGSVVDFGRWP